MSTDIAIVGAGYVGLPLATAFAQAGRPVVCVETDAARVADINAGRSHVEDVPDGVLAPLVEAGTVRATSDYAACA